MLPGSIRRRLPPGLRLPWAPLLLLSIACASGGDRDAGRTTPSARSGPPEERRGADREEEDAPAPRPREISTDRANAADPGAGTPRRNSSSSLVEEAKGYLIAGQPDAAARRLLRAIRIDPSNGFAYYHLGRARIALGDRARAAGVLEKAVALLGPYPEWRAAAERLLAETRGG